MIGQIAAIRRHPVKGFTPEALQHVDLEPEVGFPFDRIWAVENGPSGFDPQAPAHIPKQKFTVLMSLPRVAAARTRYDEATRLLHAEADGMPAFSGDMDLEDGRAAFAAWVADLVGEEDLRGPLRVCEAPSAHRFTDHPKGQVSLINLASVRDLSRRLGVELDPMRFRANVYVEGWEPWIENDWTGQPLMLGGVETQVFKPTIRCAATHVNPATAQRDLEITRALFENYGHMNCGVYLQVTAAGRLAVGDACTGPQAVSALQDVQA
ncbi:MOSC domain-containing protein [Phenylobacterium deserti]|uniref:MOSC domain-containing protein n=1 Tax=Phenylobacterium deserti TaxID=1914756 RepID=A0A328AT17_9CAUL|nr:MOSC domain-containing protein [Phenylobacterium deserti]RAK56644.1 MOSC domain-containing protein [Phenylobacterium deserti]